MTLFLVLQSFCCCSQSLFLFTQSYWSTNWTSDAMATRGLSGAALLPGILRKIFILSGKGGVGKSTLTAQLAFALAAEGRRVGVLDVDICGPSIPLMLGLNGRQPVRQSEGG